MSIELDPDSDYFGVKLNRDAEGRVVLAFGEVLAKEGDVVRYLGKNGREWERKTAEEHFAPGSTLRVRSVHVGRDYSRYTFDSVPSDWNTVMFSDPL